MAISDKDAELARKATPSGEPDPPKKKPKPPASKTDYPFDRSNDYGLGYVTDVGRSIYE